MKDQEFACPVTIDRDAYEARVAELRLREKAHSREGDAIAAARRRLPMVEIDASLPLIGAAGETTLLDAFGGRRILLAYYFMWRNGQPAEAQCEGCTHFTAQVKELSYLHANGVTYATFVQGDYEESARYRDFMGWTMPWYSVEGSVDALLAGRKPRMMYLIAYLRLGSRVFETYWTTRRGVEALGNSYPLLDRTVYGRQEAWEDSPEGWPKRPADADQFRRNGRPTAQWVRLGAGYSDLLRGS